MTVSGQKLQYTSRHATRNRRINDLISETDASVARLETWNLNQEQRQRVRSIIQRLEGITS